MLNHSDLFRKTVHLLRTTPSLWLLALISMFSMETINITADWWLSDIPINITYPIENIVNTVLSWGADPLALTGWALAITAVLMVIWCISALCSGGIIVGTQARHEGKSFPLGRGFKCGADLIWPILVLDTFLFFPLFIIILLIIGILAGGLALSAMQVGASQMSNNVASTLIGALFCTIPFFLLLIPVGFLTTIYRYITLRDVALNRPPIRQSIRAVWPLFKQRFGDIIVLLVLSILIGAIPSSIISFAESILQTISSIGRIFIVASIRLGINTVTHLIISVLWTLAVLTWQTAELEIQQAT